MISHLLKSGRLGSKVLSRSTRYVHKGDEAAPPMRYLSPTSHVVRYLIMTAALFSYPIYVMYNLDNYRPRPPNELSPELQEIIEERKARRSEGKQPILQDWPIIHEKKSQ